MRPMLATRRWNGLNRARKGRSGSRIRRTKVRTACSCASSGESQLVFTLASRIALIKYWGKRDERLFLPTNSSVSMTLDGLYTETAVTFDPALDADAFTLNGTPGVGKEAAQVYAFLDKVRALAGITTRARVASENHVPTAAGLASSASGFAALAAAASQAAGLNLAPDALSRLARQGSGSACRSIFGGFVTWRMGEREDGLDSHGVPLAPADHWPLRMLVTVLEDAPKPVKSRDGMRETVRTSPFYPGWLATANADATSPSSAPPVDTVTCSTAAPALASRATAPRPSISPCSRARLVTAAGRARRASA